MFGYLAIYWSWVRVPPGWVKIPACSSVGRALENFRRNQLCSYLQQLSAEPDAVGYQLLIESPGSNNFAPRPSFSSEPEGGWLTHAEREVAGSNPARGSGLCSSAGRAL